MTGQAATDQFHRMLFLQSILRHIRRMRIFVSEQHLQDFRNLQQAQMQAAEKFFYALK